MTEPDDSQTRAPERRRTKRFVCKAGVRVSFDATTAVVNEHGALILSTQPLEIGTTVTLSRDDRGTSRAFMIVWCGERVEGLYKIGLEMLEPDADFWAGGDADEEGG